MTESFPSTSDPLTEATQLVKNGRLVQAKEVLTKYLMQNPSSEQGWLLMSFVLADAAQQKDCLERVLRINSNNTVAQSRLAHLLGKRTEELFQGKSTPPSPPPPPAKVESPAEKSPVSPVLSVLPDSEERVERSLPLRVRTAPARASEVSALPGRKSALPGRRFWIIPIILIIIILGIVGVILYIGVIGPAISHLSITSTPTMQAVIVPTLPPVWTSTPTSTITLTSVPTSTPTVTLTPTVTATEVKSKTATKKL